MEGSITLANFSLQAHLWRIPPLCLQIFILVRFAWFPEFRPMASTQERRVSPFSRFLTCTSPAGFRLLTTYVTWYRDCSRSVVYTEYCIVSSSSNGNCSMSWASRVLLYCNKAWAHGFLQNASVAMALVETQEKQIIVTRFLQAGICNSKRSTHNRTHILPVIGHVLTQQ